MVLGYIQSTSGTPNVTIHHLQECRKCLDECRVCSEQEEGLQLWDVSHVGELGGGVYGRSRLVSLL